jgi:hypothetical protein
MSGTATFFRRMTVLAAVAAALSASIAPAMDRQSAALAGYTITVRVYDYVRLDRRILSTAEAEVGGILEKAGVSVRWVDCPTSHAVLADFPECQTPPRFNDYFLSILSSQMTATQGNYEDAMGAADDSELGSRRAAIFFNRIDSHAGGDQAPADVLMGRVMAHEIGHLLLGPNAHSRSGIMKAAWSARELSMLAAHEMFFTAEQSCKIAARLAAQVLQSQTQIASSNPR